MVNPANDNISADTGQSFPTSGGTGLTTISNKDVRDAFTNPDAYNQGMGAYWKSTNPDVANQAAPSPLAGITTLGQTANAGVTNAGLQQAGVSNAGLAQAGLNQAGIAQSGLQNAGQTTINTAPQNALLSGQIANINQLNQQAQGLGPSVAQLQAKQQGDQNVAAQMAMIGSQRGAANSSLGLRSAMNAKAVADQQAVQAGVQGRTAEELAAQQQLTSALGGTQGQVMQGAQAQAGLGQAVNLANQQAANQQMLSNAAAINQQQQNNAQMGNQVGLANAGAANQLMQQNAAAQNQVGLANAQAGNQVNLANAGSSNVAALQNTAGQNQTMLAQGQIAHQAEMANAAQQAQMTLANLQAKQQTQGLNAQEYNAMLQAQITISNNTQIAKANWANALIDQNLRQQGINAGIAVNAANNQMGLMGAGIAGGSALGAAAITASDENLKTNIKSGDRSIKNFLNEINNYKISSNFNLWSNK